MNYVFGSFSPRVHPLNYDSLAAREGCEAESGSDYFGILAFNRICLFEHDPNNYAFTQPDTVSYAIGPAQPGTSGKPFTTVWTAWVGSFGVRIGKVGRITPPSDDKGDPISLYPATKPTKISHAFDDNGLLAMAIQKTAGTIELKHYTDTLGNVATVSWIGVSPILWYAGELLRNDPALLPVVCYYLKADQPNRIYARFSNEGYATERIVMPDLRAAPDRLIGIVSNAGVAELRFIDSFGRDCTLYAPYAVTAAEKSTVAVSLAGGLYFEAAVSAPDASDKSTLAISLAGGLVFDAVVTTANQRDDGAATLAIALDSGSYDLG